MKVIPLEPICLHDLFRAGDCWVLINVVDDKIEMVLTLENYGDVDLYLTASQANRVIEMLKTAIAIARSNIYGTDPPRVSAPLSLVSTTQARWEAEKLCMTDIQTLTVEHPDHTYGRVVVGVRGRDMALGLEIGGDPDEEDDAYILFGIAYCGDIIDTLEQAMHLLTEQTPDAK